ncbi:MAG: FAD-dependent oxidoreductase [Elusimicrobia bacterium]|nr:FAD-dependent oxidoreductase [Elusimicrobiota bacterium]
MSLSVYDALVIGGGITGAGVLRDLSLRGVRALLVEKNTLGRATTAASSHLIHGGLRYLLYDRLTTHASCWDAGHIVRLASPFLTRLPILWPVYRWHRRGIGTVEALLFSYDTFQRLKSGKSHVRLNAAETLRLAPGLSPAGLVGGLIFDEYWVDPVRLTRANMDHAIRAGARVEEHTEAVKITPINGGLSVVLRLADGVVQTVSARSVVNAAGPWADAVAQGAGARVPLRLQKGSHLAYGSLPILGRTPFPLGLLLEATDRGRYIFSLPGSEKTLVGPTDLAFDGDPTSLRTTTDEIDYLLASCRRYFPNFPTRFDSTTVGARPLLGQSGPEKLLSRGYQVFDHSPVAPGMFTVAGGKMSDFRLMGQEAADAVVRWLGCSTPSCTAAMDFDGNKVDVSDAGAPPSARRRAFWDAHPRLREWHALAFLGAEYVKQNLRRAFARPREWTAEETARHYDR